MKPVWRVAGLIGLFAACMREVTPSGDEVIGSFAFNAEPIEGKCVLSEISLDAGLGFTATFSRDTQSGVAFMSLGGVEREASLKDGLLSTTFRAERVFSSCPCTVEMQETLDVVFVSRSQDEALGARCPESPLDGGVPAPNEDAGIAAPGSSAQGYDAIRACGELVDELVVPEGCDCGGGCLVRYRTSGVKQ